MVRGRGEGAMPFVLGRGTSHHIGLTSIWHFMHRRGASPPTRPLRRPSNPTTCSSPPSSLTTTGESESAPSLLAGPIRLFRRFWPAPLLPIETRLALRTVPVSERSACLYVFRNSSIAVIPVSSEISLIRWTVDLISCSGHHRHAVISPVSLPNFTVVTVSLLDPFTG